MSAKGYVVRGKDEVDVWYERLPDGDWDTTPRRTGATSLSLNEALRAAVEMTHAASHVVVLAVAEDGTETPLPSYEEALAEIDRLRTRLVDAGTDPDFIGNTRECDRGQHGACPTPTEAECDCPCHARRCPMTACHVTMESGDFDAAEAGRIARDGGTVTVVHDGQAGDHRVLSERR